MDTLWAQNLFEAFKHDDVDLAKICLRSSLADMQARVIGGEDGCPFSIGGYGFFAKSQFESQAQLLQELERINSATDFYLSTEEWMKMDKYLMEVASLSTPAFDKVVVGDSFGSLAIQQNAFHVALLFLENGLDPFVINSEENDLFIQCKQQYQALTIRLKACLSKQEEFISPSHLQIRQEWYQIHEEMTILKKAWTSFVYFLTKLQEIYRERLKEIDADLVYQRRCELLKIVSFFCCFSFEKVLSCLPFCLYL